MKTLRVVLCLALIALGSGCLHSRVDENWGKSYEAQVAWQIAHPEAASASEEPIEGIDPETAKRVAERYYEGQEKQRQRQARSVVIGD